MTVKPGNGRGEMGSALRLFTLWASVRDDFEPAPWMIACEDDVSWESDVDRCEKVFASAQELADKNGWETREIAVEVDSEAIYAAFIPTRTVGQVRASLPQEGRAS